MTENLLGMSLNKSKRAKALSYEAIEDTIYRPKLHIMFGK